MSVARAAAGAAVVVVVGCAADPPTTAPPASRYTDEPPPPDALADDGAAVDAPGLRAGCDDDDDPLTSTTTSGFCDDRRDDDCAVNVADEECVGVAGAVPLACRSADEPCPATQPADAAPDWDCTGDVPDGVVAYAAYADETNVAVRSFCAYVYASAVVDGDHYVAIRLVNGPTTAGADDACRADVAARRHLFFADLDGSSDPGACDGVAIVHPDDVAEQLLSNRCRKMIRNVARNDPAFEPDVQYFAAGADDAAAKLAVLDTAEIACIGIDGTNGAPIRPNEVWTVQAAAPIVLVPR